MPFQLSPGVNVTEIDLTTIVPAVATTDAAFVGTFEWGPANTVVLVDTQDKLRARFGKPTNNTAGYWFTASNFLDYGNKLHLVRAVHNTAKNATGGGGGATSTGLLITNDDEYVEKEYDTGSQSVGMWSAKYPGNLGNALRVSVIDSGIDGDGSAGLSNTATGVKANGYAGNTYVDTLVGSNNSIQIGDLLTFSNQPGEFKAVRFEYRAAGDPHAGATATRIHLNKPLSNTFIKNGGDDSSSSVSRKWEFYNNFDDIPGTSDWAAARDGANDEIHVAVSDDTGELTGTKGQVLEAYPFVSKAPSAKKADGETNYYRDVINTQSQYIRWLDHPATGDLETVTGTAAVYNTAWGQDPTPGKGNNYVQIKRNAAGASGFGAATLPIANTLTGGTHGDSHVATEGQRLQGWDHFNDADKIDISLVLGGPENSTVALSLIDNIAERRKDCVVFLSPRKNDVVNANDPTNNVIGFRKADDLNSRSTSYAVLDSGWKYQYDKYNDVYRWIPLNADTAGLCVATDQSRDPWYSPAGFNRGNVKNALRLAFNPSKAQRDQLYKNGINPVVTFPGQGTVLFGDKTLLAKPSAFDRINVRRLFIVLEKAIATAAKFMLFEFNDEFTRAQFRNMVEPFLRDVQGRRGIFDFRVVCDESNNTGEVIDRNEFVGDIYIKPARSINFIQLNFVAVRTGVDFEEVVGKF
tara:strand:+ start:1287 stop:3365 length:2079 start_codon:yes stop_codon:yes gene_type:complete